MILSLKVNEMLVWFELLCKLEVAWGSHRICIFCNNPDASSHSLRSCWQKTKSFENRAHALFTPAVYLLTSGGRGRGGGASKSFEWMDPDDEQADNKSSHANSPARRLNLRCLRKIRSGLSTNSPRWRNNSFLFSTTPLRMSNFNVWKVVKKSLRVNNLLVLASSIKWSNFKDKTFVYLHRYCSKGKGIARHFPSRQRIRCRRAESQACGPISLVLLSAPRVRR